SRESILLLIPPAIVFGTFLFVGVLYPIAFAYSILTITLIFLSILCVLLSPVFTFLSYQVMRTASDNKRSMRILAFVANVVLLCLLPFSLLASCFNIELGW
ncbi:MAG: hypothetical protein R6V03_00810, partial [Kiritimatiellia bacterium]